MLNGRVVALQELAGADPGSYFSEALKKIIYYYQIQVDNDGMSHSKCNTSVQYSGKYCNPAIGGHL